MFRFTKQLRLNQAADFRNLFKVGKKLNTPHFAIYSLPNQLPYPRLGLIVAKKAVRSAVRRNQIKRIARESFRLNQVSLTGLDVMVLTYKAINNLDKVELRTHLERGWSKLVEEYKKA